MTYDWSDTHFSCVRKTVQPIRICAKFFFFKFSYDKLTFIHTHFKKFGPGKTLTVSKYTTKIGSLRLSVWDTAIICA